MNSAYESVATSGPQHQQMLTLQRKLHRLSNQVVFSPKSTAAPAPVAQVAYLGRTPAAVDYKSGVLNALLQGIGTPKNPSKKFE